MKIATRIILAGAVLIGLTVSALAQGFPSRPMRILIAFPPGGTSTTSTQPIAAYLARTLGQPVTLEYHPGAGGNVAAMAAIQAPADGHTLFFGHAGPLAINHHINKKSFFDPATDFKPVTLAVSYPLVIATQPALGTADLKSFVAYARTRHLDLVFGSAGNGSFQHLAGEMFSGAAGVRFLHVPFAGGGPLQAAFLKGDVQVVFETGSNVVAHVQSGKMRALAVMSPTRLPALPQAPTIAEAGGPEVIAAAWFGFVVSGKTPTEIVERLDTTIQAALGDPAVMATLQAIGARIDALGPAPFARFIAEENVRWKRIVETAGIQPD
jgi:tripartite-type tricarboxylate transporter receptor subunit TctC